LMGADLLQALLLISLVVTAYLSIKFKDLIACAVSLGIFSFLLSLEYYVLQAPDVAIAEAGIGAGLTTAIFIIAIKGTSRREVEE
jgi:energy-converting hydrogenase B subunit D